jgi:hypothetical protein
LGYVPKRPNVVVRRTAGKVPDQVHEIRYRLSDGVYRHYLYLFALGFGRGFGVAVVAKPLDCSSALAIACASGTVTLFLLPEHLFVAHITILLYPPNMPQTFCPWLYLNGALP